MFLLLLVLVNVVNAVNALDLLFYSSSVLLNGTDRLIETNPFCNYSAIQFNGSSLLFSSNRNVWTKTTTFPFVRKGTYGDYLMNPTMLPIDGVLWWVELCNSTDTHGVGSSYTYIPPSAEYGLLFPCWLKAPVVYVCEGVVPTTNSPTNQPTNSPTLQPTRLPTISPTPRPTKVPTSNGGIQHGVVFASVIVVGVLFGSWLFLF